MNESSMKAERMQDRSVPTDSSKKGATREEVEAALDEGRIRKPKKSFLKRLVGNWGIRIGIIGVLLGGVGAYEAYQHHAIPGINQTEKTLVPDLIFDNTKAEGIIGAITETSMPQSEIDALYPDAFAKINDGKNTLQFEFPLDLSTSPNPNANIAYAKSFTGGPGIATDSEERALFEEKGYYDGIEFKNVPGSTMITSPVDGTLILWRAEDVKSPSNGSDITDALVDFVAPNGNHYRIDIYGGFVQGGEGSNFVFKSLATSPSLFIKNTYNGKLIYTSSNPKEIRKGESIMKIIDTQKSPIDVSFGISIAREGKTGESLNVWNPPVPTNIELLTQDNKILVPSGK